MLKFFEIFCLVLISRAIFTESTGPTSTTQDSNGQTSATEEKKGEGLVKSFTTQLSGIKNYVSAGSGSDSNSVSLESTISQIPEQYRAQFITALKLLLQNTIPGGPMVVPLLESLAKKFISPEQLKEAEKNMPKPKPRDTTDIILYRLIAEDIQDEEKLKQFMDLGSDSAAVKQVVGSFLMSLKKLVDVFVKNYDAKMRDTSELILKGLEVKHS